MAAAAFSIRGYAASMRGQAAAEGRRPLSVEELPPIKAPRFRWWADELASAVPAAASPRRSKPPKKTSISDLLEAAPPADDSGCNEQTEVGGDEALFTIVRRAMEEKKRKRRPHEEAAAAAAALESSEGREPEGTFPARMEAHENSNLPDELDNHPSEKPEASQHRREEREKISGRWKQGKIYNKKKKKKKKADTQKCIDNYKADKVAKQHDLGKSLPRQGFLKYTKHTSVNVAKEKHGNSKCKEVIELCCKSVKRVKFSEADGVLGSKMQNCELPSARSLCKLSSVAMASSSPSLSSSASVSIEGGKSITAESGSSQMPKEPFTKTKEANKHYDHQDSGEPSDKERSASMSIEGGKSVSAESGSSHMPKEPFTKTKEANKHYDHQDSGEPSDKERSAPLIDLNMAPPEFADLDCMYDSNLEVPNLEHTHDGTLNSDAELHDGRENWMNLAFDSHRLESQPPAANLERIRSSRSAGSFFHGEAIKVSDIDAVGPPLSLRELGETHRGCCDVLVKDTKTASTSPCALPDHTFQDSFQQHKNWFSTNPNHGCSQLSTGGKYPSWPSHECNVSRSKELYSLSELNVQRKCSPSTGRTVRLMGKDLAVCITRGESFAQTAQKHAGTSTNDYLKTNEFLPQGQPFFSLQAQSFPNVAVNFTSTIQASTYHASTSQAYFGYRTPHHSSQPFPVANVFSGDQLSYENREGDFSNPQTNQPFLLGCPPLPNHGSAAFHQNSPPTWRYFLDPTTGAEPPTAPFLPITRQQWTPSSVFHANVPQQTNLPRQHVVHSTSSSVFPLNSASHTHSHSGQLVQEVSNSSRDVALLSINPENGTGRVVPDNSIASPSGRCVQNRSGPVKLNPGAKDILVPSDSTHGNSVLVYSYLSLRSRSENAVGSQKKGI